MWFEHSVPAPERLPDVPMRLGDCIRAFASGTTRIDIHVRVGEGWRKVNALRFADGDDTEDPGQIAALVKACADHHAAEANAPGQYRAMVWRYFGGELERRKAAFQVELARPGQRMPPPPRRTPPPPRRSRRDQWRKAIETKLMLDELLAQPGGVPFDPFAALRSPPETPLEWVLREIADMAAIFEHGQRTGTADGMDLAELDIRWKLALLRGQEDADLWTELAPMIETGLAKLRKDALTKRTTTRDLEPPSSTAPSAAPSSTSPVDDPNAERTEGAPPSTIDG